jgi:cytidylate kinase
MTLVTLSAAYGTGGSRLGPQLAERLGVPFLDRAIPAAVAQRLAVPLEHASAHDQSVGSLLARMAMRLAPLGQAFGAAASASDPLDEDAYRRATEGIIREQAATGDGVILGRAAALVLADAPHALHVRLRGAREARIEQAMRLRAIDRATAAREQAETDRAREAYVRHFYRADARECVHYHLTIDSTALPLETVLELIALAATARTL